MKIILTAIYVHAGARLVVYFGAVAHTVLAAVAPSYVFLHRENDISALDDFATKVS